METVRLQPLPSITFSVNLTKDLTTTLFLNQSAFIS